MDPKKTQECEVCTGSGGWDIADDPEVYDEWIDCEVCEGTGEVDPDTAGDEFVPERDAWTAND